MVSLSLKADVTTMKDKLAPERTTSAQPAREPTQWRWILLTSCALLALVGMLGRSRRPAPDGAAGDSSRVAAAESASGSTFPRAQGFSRHGSSTATPTATAEEIVAAKVARFGRSRREFVYATARRTGKPVPPDVERFFDAIEAGDWERIETEWKGLSKRSHQYEGSTDDPGLDPFWMAVLDAYGAAEQAHEWPAQQLLDYGNAILGSLRPGMVYVGGTDNGRWIPELLNETGEGESHVMITQNALADGRYLEYLTELYGGRLTTLTSEDSQRAFQDYLADAQRRLEHDQQFPDEPKQLRPGEDVRVVDGKVQVSGQVAVMSINEKLLQAMMTKNPDLSFAIQESFPFKGTYADALPLGPLMELRAREGQDASMAERAEQTLDYWRGAAQQLLSDPDAIGSAAALKSYSHDSVATANLLMAHNLQAEAEEAYRLATRFWPDNPESTVGLADLLASTGRPDEARQLLNDFAHDHPDQQEGLRRHSAAWRLIVDRPP
jgi:hypothetical protein